MFTSTTSQQDVYYWCYKEGRWQLITAHGFPADYRRLPNVPKYYEWMLQELNINYNVDGEYCIIFDPTCVECEDYTAPLMTAIYDSKVPDLLKGYVLKPSNITDRVPTERMFLTAKEYNEVAQQKMCEFRLLSEKEDFDRNFTRDSNDGISYCWSLDYDNFGNLPAEELQDKYFLFNVDSHVNHDYMMGFIDYLVILKSAVKPRQVLTIKVPKNWAGKVIGRGGANAKELARLLDVRFVKVETFDPFEFED